MDVDRTEDFREVLDTIMDRSPQAWVYLPGAGNWNLMSQAATLVSEEVSPEDEDLPDAGVPEFALSRGLIQAIDVASLQDVVSNALLQRPSAPAEDLFQAFSFYHERDAFIEF